MAQIVYLKTACGRCSGHIEYPSQLEGQSIECPHCHQPMPLPPPLPPSFTPPPPPIPRQQAELDKIEIGGGTLSDIVPTRDAYVYSTSYTFCFPFTFAPFTTVGPLDRKEFKIRAISFMWNGKDRPQLPRLHREVFDAVSAYGLDWLYRLSMLAFTFRDTYEGARGHVAAVKLLADGARESGDAFPFSPLLLSCLRSYAPRCWPQPDELRKARDF
jgi:hypothetical protein